MKIENQFSGKIFNKLVKYEEELKNAYDSSNGTKTKYFILDDLLPIDDVKEIYNQFGREKQFWFHRSTFREKKSTYAKIDELNPIIRDITEAFHHENVLEIIGRITGIKDIKGDPSLYAGGLSMMKNGDFLNPHIDNSHDSSREKYRRLNLLFYVTPNWEGINGGNLELWDEKVTKPVTLTSKFNRLIVMETRDYSYHSVSPVKVNADRCCVSNYYFSVSSPEDFDYYHVTSFTGRPNQFLRRAYGRIDNSLRNQISKVFGISRGKGLSRF